MFVQCLLQLLSDSSDYDELQLPCISTLTANICRETVCARVSNREKERVRGGKDRRRQKGVG